jgi:hypothetical protein
MNFLFGLCDRWVIDNCYVHRGGAGIWVDPSTHVYITNCTVKDIIADGINFVRGARTVTPSSMLALIQ